jgi:hypothetical protein
MAVTFDNKTEVSTGGTDAATLSATLTVGANSNRALTVGLVFSSNTIPSGLTVNWDTAGANQSLTAVTNASSATTGSAIRYALVGNSSGTSLTCKASWTGNLTAYLDVEAWFNVDQTGGATSFPNGNNATGNSGTASVTLTSATGNAIIACHGSNNIAFSGTISDTLVYTDTAGNLCNGAANRAAGSASHALTAMTSVGTAVWNSVGHDILVFTGGAPTVKLGTPRLLLGVGT